MTIFRVALAVFALGVAAAVCGLVLAWGAHTVAAQPVAGLLILGAGGAWLAEVGLVTGWLLPGLVGVEHG